MSSRRSRSGGSSISIVFSRNSRSWRKRFSSASWSGDDVGRGDDPHVDRDRLVRADRHHLALLERGQQLGLQMKRQIADLVEEQGAVVGGLEAARSGRRRRR